MILGYTLIFLINGALFMGGVQGIDNAMNIAEFTLWIMAILNAFSAFAPDNMLPLSKKKFRRYMGVTATTLTIFHAVFWGYIWGPVIWGVAAIIMFVRKLEILKAQK